MRDLHLGYTDAELASSPYAPFYRPQMAKLPPHVKHALLNGAVAEELMPGVEFAAQLQNSSYWPVETGYTLAADKSARVSVLSHMPGVTPAMWEWWFAWHGSEAQRYKLWHPRSHVHVAWEDGLDDLGAYVGHHLCVSNELRFELLLARAIGSDCCDEGAGAHGILRQQPL